jgi:polar amino acid transport system substrate-binding protein
VAAAAPTVLAQVAPTVAAAATQVAAAVPTAPAAAAGGEIKTIKPGVLTVAIDNDMPYCKDEGGKLIGADGEILGEIATRLNLKVEMAVMEWAAEIQSVQSGRADTNICGMAFTEERAKTVNLSEPAYYQVTEFTQLKDSNIKTVEDLKGKKIGTIQGYFYIPNLKKVPWIGEENLKLYNTIDAAVQDLIAKRVDALMLGAATSAWLATQHPEWNLKYEPAQPTEFLPDTKDKAKTVFSTNLENKSLLEAMNVEIVKMRKDGTVAKIMAKYNMSDPAFLIE